MNSNKTALTNGQQQKPGTVASNPSANNFTKSSTHRTVTFVAEPHKEPAALSKKNPQIISNSVPLSNVMIPMERKPLNIEVLLEQKYQKEKDALAAQQAYEYELALLSLNNKGFLETQGEKTEKCMRALLKVQNTSISVASTVKSSMSNLTDLIETHHSRNKEQEDKFEALAKSHDNLKLKHSELEKKHAALEQENGVLRQEIEWLSEIFTKLSRDNPEIVEKLLLDNPERLQK